MHRLAVFFLPERAPVPIDITQLNGRPTPTKQRTRSLENVGGSEIRSEFGEIRQTDLSVIRGVEFVEKSW